MKKREIEISRKLVRIAKELVLEDLFDEVELAKSLFSRHVRPVLKSREFVEGGFCQVEFPVKQFNSINVIACLVRLGSDDKDNREIKRKYPSWMMDYPVGQGDSQLDGNEIRIAVYGGDDFGMNFYKDTFVHEMLHGFDGIQERFNSDDDYGHKYLDVPNDENNNFGIPYPGMPGKFGRLPLTDSHYAEYYTCKAERREYVNDLAVFIKGYARRNKMTADEFCGEIKEMLDDEPEFKKWIDENSGLDFNPMMMLYHLSFGNTKNGDSSDAKKIVDAISDRLKSR